MRAARAFVFIPHTLVTLVALGACSGKDQPAAASNKAKAEEKPIHVESVVASEQPVPKTMSVTGTLEADKRTELAANAMGRVVRTFVERGDHVKAGALIAQLDARGATLSHTEAEANAKAIADQLKSVQQECDRYQALRGKGAITQQEFDRQASQCLTQTSSEAAARARVAEAARVVSDAAIRAPFDGVISERFVNVGDYVQPSSKVVTLLDDDPLRLRISVPEPGIPYAKEGTVVKFRTLVMPDRDFAATIKYVGREVRPTTRDVIDEAIVDNKAQLLLPGTFVTVQLPVGTVNLPVVPKNAVVKLDDGQTVFVVVNGRVEQRAVQTTVEVNGGVAAAEGVKKGDRVVVNPPPNLKDGTRVE
ncbi:MAG TPA: efflux RND transporter periplasmic adaptor subunit [Polyangiales bacterium]|nr:efflux RND transporter periplasmic adaptor subunit [Polyangiales bacterium]